MRKNTRLNRTAFTFVEFLSVAAVLATLISVLVPAFGLGK